MKRLLAVVLATIMAVSSPMAVSAQEIIDVSAGAAGTESLEEQVTGSLSEDVSGVALEASDEIGTVTALEGAESLQDKYHVNFKLTGAQALEKQRLFKVLDSFENAVPGKDYFENQVIVEAETKEKADEIAKGFDGEVLNWQEGLAVIHTKLSALEAVTLAADTEIQLPAVYPNFRYTTDDQKYRMSDSIDESLERRMKGEASELRNSMDAILGQFDQGKEDVPEEKNVDLMMEAATGAAAATVSDPDIPKQWFHTMIDTFNAWKVTKGKGVKVAVIDSGVSMNHVEFKDRVQAECTVVSPINGALDNAGHGTHVAGIIGAAAGNGEGGVGVAPEAEIISIKALDFDNENFNRDVDEVSGSTYEIVLAVLRAVELDARVINMSLGGPSNVTDVIYQKAVDEAVGKGIVVIAAAGNETMDISKKENRTVPACLNGVVTVASLDRYGELSYFSNYGDIDVAAPGGSALKKDDPDDIYSTSVTPSGYEYMAGTSMACPVVSGVAALVIASGSYGASAGDANAIAGVLKNSCVNIGNKKNFGAGRINAAAAVKAISIYTKDNNFNVAAGKKLNLLVKSSEKSIRPSWEIVGEAAGCTISATGAFKAPKTLDKEKVEVEVKATCGNASDTVIVTVYSKAGTIKSDTGKSITLEYLTAEQFKVTSDLPYTYKTSNNKVATVDANGMIYALSNGKATVTATTVGGKKVSVKVKVTGTPYSIERIAAVNSKDEKGAEMFAQSPMAEDFLVYPVSAGKSIKFKAISVWPYSTSSNKKVKWDTISNVSGVSVKNGALKMPKNITKPTPVVVTAVPEYWVGKPAEQQETRAVAVEGFKPIKSFNFAEGNADGTILDSKITTKKSVSVAVGETKPVFYSYVFTGKDEDALAMNPLPYLEISDSDIADAFVGTVSGKLCIGIEGKKAGKCKITMVSMDGAYKKATIDVTVK